jgi:hypothetical protein
MSAPVLFKKPNAVWQTALQKNPDCLQPGQQLKN